MVSAGHVSGTRGSGTVSSADDVLGMSGVGGVCEMCKCLGWVGVGGDGVWVWALPILWEQRE